MSIQRIRETCCGPLADGLDEPTAELVAKRFAALGDPGRLRLLGLLVSAERGEVCACDLVEPLGKSQPTVSHHLKVLREAGLIEGDRRGTWIWYRAVPEAISELGAVLGTQSPPPARRPPGKGGATRASSPAAAQAPLVTRAARVARRARSAT